VRIVPPALPLTITVGFTCPHCQRPVTLHLVTREQARQAIGVHYRQHEER